jgi:uroporphyrin-III C-methyltransferase / precorrin-2 dehydrogenase / sirohydrochlorin ferrochelatase
MTSSSSFPSGRVCLVGAGPGDPDLLTLKALKALQSADAVVHDMLVSAAILALANPHAALIPAGKRAGQPSARQEEINALIVTLARQGKYVVRLKSGDPGIFGRAGEEIAACRAANVPVSVVAGVTAASAAAASLGVSLTHRDHARRLQFLTGHSREGVLPADIDWAGIADPHATTVLYMGARTLGDFAQRAMAAGLPGAVPAVAIENASRPDQRVWRAALADMRHVLEHAAPQGPVVVLVGYALGE